MLTNTSQPLPECKSAPRERFNNDQDFLTYLSEQVVAGKDEFGDPITSVDQLKDFYALLVPANHRKTVDRDRYMNRALILQTLYQDINDAFLRLDGSSALDDFFCHNIFAVSAVDHKHKLLTKKANKTSDFTFKKLSNVRKSMVAMSGGRVVSLAAFKLQRESATSLLSKPEQIDKMLLNVSLLAVDDVEVIAEYKKIVEAYKLVADLESASGEASLKLKVLERYIEQSEAFYEAKNASIKVSVFSVEMAKRLLRFAN